MINTIFYFASSKQEYDSFAQSSGIHERTICFVPTGDGKGDIYKNGVKYSGSIDSNELYSEILRVINNNPSIINSTGDYSILSFALNGTSLSLQQKTGNSSQNEFTVNLKDAVANAIQTLVNEGDTIINLIGKKTTVDVTPIQTTGTHIANITVDGVLKLLYAPAGSGSSNPLTVDAALSTTSTNPVQNKIIAGALNEISGALNGKQDKLVSGQNIKTINGETLLGSGNIIVNGGNGSTTLAGLNDVAISNPTNGQVLKYDETSQKWYNGIDTTGTGGGGNSGGIIDEDLENLRNDYNTKITNINTDIDGLQDTIDSIINATDAQIRERFKNAFSTYQELIQYYINSGDNTYTNYNFGEDDANEWASSMGLITKNADGTYTVGWSTLQQSYDSLSGRVSRIEANQSAGGDIDYDALQAGLYTYIQDKIAQSGLDATWAKFVNKDDESMLMLEWMQSALKLYATDGTTYAQLLSAAKDYANNKDAYAGLITRVTDLEGTVASIDLSSYVKNTDIDGIVSTSISGIMTQNSENEAVASLFSRLQRVETESGETTSALSALRTEVHELANGGFLTENTLTAAIQNKQDDIVTTLSSAGVALSAQVGEDIEAAKAAVLSETQGAMSGFVSEANSYTDGKFNEARAGMVAQGELDDYVKKAEVIASVNEDGSNVTISADKIDIDGLVPKLNVGDLVAQYISDGSTKVSVKYLLELMGGSRALTAYYNGKATEILAKGLSYKKEITCNEGYTLEGCIKVVMGNEDVTGRVLGKTPTGIYDSGMMTYVLNSWTINIENVTGDVFITKADPIDIRYWRLSGPSVIREGETAQLTLEFNGEDCNIARCEISDTSKLSLITDLSNFAKTITVRGIQSGTVDVTVYTEYSNQSTPKTISIVPSGSPVADSFTCADCDVPVGTSYVQLSPVVTWRSGGGSASYDVSYNVPSEYSSYISIDGNGYITGKKVGYAEVELVLSYSTAGNTVEASTTASVYVTDKLFADGSATTVYADIFGNSALAYQSVIVNGSVKKDVERMASISDTDRFAILLSNTENDTNAAGATVKSISADWIPSGSVLILEYDGLYYLTFKVNRFNDAVSHYAAISDYTTPKTLYKDDEYHNRRGYITIAAKDGSEYTINVVQYSRFGFYRELISDDRTAVSAYYLTPGYAFNRKGTEGATSDGIHWYTTEKAKSSDYYPNSIAMPSDEKWFCVAIVKDSVSAIGMPNSKIGEQLSGTTYAYELTMDPMLKRWN